VIFLNCLGEPSWSILATSAEEVERFFQETIDNRLALSDMEHVFL